MRIRLPDGTVRAGRTSDLSDVGLDPAAVVDAVRTPDGAGDDIQSPAATDSGLWVDCPTPGPGYDRLARIPVPESPPSRGQLLVAVGRSRGLQTPVDDELAQLEARLAEHEGQTEDDSPDHIVPSASELREARRRVAAAGDDQTRLRERVATLRGRLNAHREAGDDASAASTQSELVEIATKLSEVETERIAAEQRLEALERAARRARDGREERLRLHDAIANRRRERRSYFCAELSEEFDDTVRELTAEFFEPTDAASDASSNSNSNSNPNRSSVVDALAAVRLADLDAPVVLTRRFFGDVETAARWLDTPVIRC
ncbi:hypothetical protein E6P09_04245 [Haloferax mediterranei ATCC 33500]|uniref:Uncharacterized protein n=1 Tax=Haloferax mediterranei (strain ATCC 33500 / DSM 1411 / JCM 8866 / NBRC 14739 / NCIMB 2177 / R-4) TaxID=523841 RepID=I3R158_HALMT|nr:hypothetical protein [Haloferax mediterranei]AFK17968.1 hypothetical protein HFX_0227 [Haloferax mediterranei ATCC 33500]AHZ22610.1 hypothetical protein BM92_08120 [Haloferax mediterranei ATCC 33500]EMA02754.1 hypothetical protein C439_09235 [Haloferax mediterranei ATCC 33500]MDX5988061.1 hypothetical protein [Haloferax mediterranei ATCC 33500]QCQ74520.1 hypothetical protein E6P09_04245 [Haloferax mediterranei ATCC 33500]